MIAAEESHRTSGLTWKSLFRERPLFARLWRAALLHFMAQMCGAAAMKYYLPTLLAGLGIGTRVALMAGAIEVTLKVGCSVLEMLVVDRWGRRGTLGIGCAAMAMGMLVSLELAARNLWRECSRWTQINGVLPLLYPDSASRVANAVCVVFIFVYAFGYSLGFGPAAWLYGAEVRWPHGLTWPLALHSLSGFLTCSRPDLPDLRACERAQLLGLGRSRRVHHRRTDLARGRRQARKQRLLLLHGG